MPILCEMSEVWNCVQRKEESACKRLVCMVTTSVAFGNINVEVMQSILKFTVLFKCVDRKTASVKI